MYKKHTYPWEVLTVVGTTDVKTNNDNVGKMVDIVELVGREGAKGKNEVLRKEAAWIW